MSRILYSLDPDALADAATPGTLTYSSDERLTVASMHQITVVPAESATGKVKLVMSGLGGTITNVEYIKDGLGADIEIDLANGPQSVTFEAAVMAVGVIVTVELAEGCTVHLAGW